MAKRNLILSLLGLLLLVASVSGFYWLVFSANVQGGQENIYQLKIKRGMSFEAILDIMQVDDIIIDKIRFRVLARLLNSKGKIKAGKYEIRGGISNYQLLNSLVKGKVTHIRVTIPEGKHARQIASLLQAKVEIDSARFVSVAQDSLFIQELGLKTLSLEGYLFPETYNFIWGMNSKDIIRVMVKQFKIQFDSSLTKRMNEMGLTISETLTLASIIEGEAVIDSEREIISAVYHNRLKKRMPLQADPTIQYIIPDGPRRLLNQDLSIDSPYNTYKYSGLPPGPINNPGLKSIKASLYPAEVKFLYFVANGDGSHTFSNTLREHSKAKSRFDRLRREIRQKKVEDGNGG